MTRPIDLKPGFAARARQAREHAWLSLDTAVVALGTTAAELDRLEAGVARTIEPLLLRKMATAYSVSQVWLFSGGKELAPAWAREGQR